MDCKACANYEPVKVERPTDHPGRIFAEDLRIGMVIRRYSTKRCRKCLIVILGEVEDLTVPTLHLSVGHKPFECATWLAPAGLQPYKITGQWQADTWCEEVT